MRVGQLDCLQKYSKLIPGAAATVQTLRTKYDLKIGSTTGFTEEMVDILLSDAALQGYKPDSSVAGDTVKNGARPNPHMVYKNLLQYFDHFGTQRFHFQHK